MGLNDCGKNTMCILEIVSNSLSCNNTEVRCSTLDRLIYASSSSRALDCYTHMPDQRSGCPWYKKLGIEAAVLGAYAGCVVADIPDGETLLVPCILAATEVLGATADCVCDIIPDKFKSVACSSDMPDRRTDDCFDEPCGVCVPTMVTYYEDCEANKGPNASVTCKTLTVNMYVPDTPLMSRAAKLKCMCTDRRDGTFKNVLCS